MKTAALASIRDDPATRCMRRANRWQQKTPDSRPAIAKDFENCYSYFDRVYLGVPPFGHASFFCAYNSAQDSILKAWA
jgi:hypothetical protein